MPEVGLEPTWAKSPRVFETRASAASATPAHFLRKSQRERTSDYIALPSGKSNTTGHSMRTNSGFRRALTGTRVELTCSIAKEYEAKYTDAVQHAVERLTRVTPAPSSDRSSTAGFGPWRIAEVTETF